MIKTKLLLVAMVAASVILPAAAVRADRIQIQIGDRPFYNHGPRYWDGDYQMVWVPGHMSRFGNHWVHGQYIRGEHRHVDMRHRESGERFENQGVEFRR